MSKQEGLELVCKDCHSKFIFSNDEAKFYTEKGLEVPKRCHKCRVIAKIARRETVNVLKKYGIIEFVEADTAENEAERA
jgi:proteasome assembly chaperone (PAC2) family protein